MTPLPVGAAALQDDGILRYDLAMPLLALVPLMITAGVAALVLLWPRVRTGPSGARLMAEVGITALLLLGLILGLLLALQRLS